MTYVSSGERSYMVWSYREHIGTPDDTGSMLYIAEADDAKPWQLAYHAEDALESRLRSDGIHRIHCDVHGMPRFDLSAERDLNPSLREVSIQVILSNGEGGVLKDEDTKLYTNTARG